MPLINFVYKSYTPLRNVEVDKFSTSNKCNKSKLISGIGISRRNTVKSREKKSRHVHTGLSISHGRAHAHISRAGVGTCICTRTRRSRDILTLGGRAARTLHRVVHVNSLSRCLTGLLTAFLRIRIQLARSPPSAYYLATGP